METLTFKKTVELKAPVGVVWHALTTPEIIKQYLFGTETITDWKKGSAIVYRGVWEGKAYEDKGYVLDIEKEKFIVYSYWSSFSGKEDVPENYQNVRYELAAMNDTTSFTITQEGLPSAEALDHTTTSWGLIVDNLKKIIEK